MDLGRTLGRLWEDFEKTLRTLWKYIGKHVSGARGGGLWGFPEVLGEEKNSWEIWKDFGGFPKMSFWWRFGKPVKSAQFPSLYTTFVAFVKSKTMAARYTKKRQFGSISDSALPRAD
jgi:hypothetical protein